VVNLWVGIPYSMLITSGILMNIPKDLYESASIDGASPARMFFSITMPYMIFVTTPYLITAFVGNINNFNVIYLLTRGGPLVTDYYQAGKTDLLVTWLYKLTVERQNYSLASTIGIFVFVVSAGLSLLVYNASGSSRREEEFQ
jgi:arabinogalactan oligomer/maltooligosaccharide transport system permease protein